MNEQHGNRYNRENWQDWQLADGPRYSKWPFVFGHTIAHTISTTFTAKKAIRAANDDSSANIFTLPIGTSTAAMANVRIAASHGVCRTGRSRANTLEISLSRAIEKATREVAITVIRTVFAVANSAIALSMLDAPGHAF